MNKIKKHKTCCECFASIISFPHSQFDSGLDGKVICALNYPIKPPKKTNYELQEKIKIGESNECIPITKCPKPKNRKEFCEARLPITLLKN